MVEVHEIDENLISLKEFVVYFDLFRRRSQSTMENRSFRICRYYVGFNYFKSRSSD